MHYRRGFAKTIIFYKNIDYTEQTRVALVNKNADLVAESRRYIMRITGYETEGKAELDNFIAHLHFDLLRAIKKSI